MNSWNPDIIGKWLPLWHRPGYLKHPYSEDYKCSICGYEQYTLFMGPPAQCPACGASMENGEAIPAMPIKAKPVSLVSVVRCRDCRYWQTGIAYETTGRCKHSEHKGLICNSNFFCAYGEAKA